MLSYATPALRRLFTVLCVTGGVVGTAIVGAEGARADDETGYALFSKDNNNTRISYPELVKLLNNALGQAQQVNIYNGACHGGGLLSAAGNLKMPYFVGVAQSDPKKCAVESSAMKTADPPGSIKIDGSYYSGFAAYLAKGLQDAGKPPTAQSLYDGAKDGLNADPNLKNKDSPQSGSGNGANVNLPINGGASSNHVLIFNGDTAGLPYDPRREQYRAAAQTGYGFTNTGNSVQNYDGAYKPQTFDGTKFDGTGTLANLNKALDNLKTSVTANPNKQLINIFLNGHGYYAAAADPRQNGMNNQPKDGLVVAGGETTLTLATDAEFWSELEVGFKPNPNDLIRILPAQFWLSVSEDSVSGPIGVAIDGLNLGAFMLPPGTDGSMFAVNLPDSYTSALLALADGASSLAVTFTVGSNDWFRIATDDDALLDPNFLEPQAGFGISTVVDVAYTGAVNPIPEPPTAILFTLAILGAPLVRRAARV